MRRHRTEQADEIRALDGQEAIDRRAAFVVRIRDDHVDDDRQTVGRVEHALCTAQADPFCAVAHGAGRILGRVGVRTHAQSRMLVGPFEQCDQ